MELSESAMSRDVYIIIKSIRAPKFFKVKSDAGGTESGDANSKKSALNALNGSSWYIVSINQDNKNTNII